MKKLKLWILIIGLIFISACGASGDMGGESSAPQPENQKIEEGAADTQPEITGESNPDRKTIDTLNLYMTVLNFQEADTRIQDLLKQHKGILISSNQYKSGNYRRTGDYQFKIPPEENDVFYKEIKTLGEIESENKGSDDVTKQHTNIELRMNSLKAQHERLTELLERATTMADIIALEDKMTQNITQQEELQAQLDDLNSQIDYVNYSIQISETLDQVPEVEGGFFRRIIVAFQSTGIWFINVVQNILIVLIYLLPYLIAAAIIAYIYKRYRKKHPRKKPEGYDSNYRSIIRWKKKETEDNTGIKEDSDPENKS